MRYSAIPIQRRNEAMRQTERDPQKELEAQLRFEITLAEISTGFVNMPTDQVSHGIQETQRRVCESLGLARVSLWQTSESDPESFVLTLSVYQALHVL